MWGRNWKKNTQNIFYLYIFISWKKGGGRSALNIFSIFYTHYRIPNEHMMTINFDTITNNYEVIYVIITDEILFKKNRYEFSSAFSKYGSTFICRRHTWRDLVYEYSWAKSPMISGYVLFLWFSDSVSSQNLIPLQIVIYSINDCRFFDNSARNNIYLGTYTFCQQTFIVFNQPWTHYLSDYFYLRLK